MKEPENNERIDDSLDDYPETEEDMFVYDTDDDRELGIIGAASEEPVVAEEVEEPEHKGGRHAKGNHAEQAQPAYMRKSARMRKILIVVIVLLLLLLVGGGVLIWQLIQTSETAAVQQTQITASESNAMDNETAAKDASTTTTKKTTVPNLVALLGLPSADAIARLQHGAQLSSAIEVNEEGNPIKQELRVALTEEPADSKGGTPTVFLSLDEAGNVIQAGYSVATSSLGYGSLSFSDAIINEKIIEKTLDEAGLTVAQDSVILPEDKTVYSTYGSDGTTLAKEYCSFEGTGDAAGVVHPWTAVLSYDYSMANATGNLADTIRTIYVYIGV